MIKPEEFKEVVEEPRKCDLCGKTAPYCFHFRGMVGADFFVCTPCLHSNPEAEEARNVCLISKAKKKKK